MSSTGPTIAATVSDPAEPQHPYPPRYRHLKRWLWISLVVVLLITGLRLWWAYEASKRLNTRVDALREQGEPVLPVDFIAPALPDEENAVPLLNQAFGVANVSLTPSSNNWTFPDHPPYPREWHDAVAQSLATNARAMSLVRQARQRRHFNWGFRFASPVINLMLPSLSQARGMAMILADASTQTHLDGDDMAALQLVGDVRFVAEGIDQQPMLVSHLVSLGMYAMAGHRLQIIATDLRIAGHGHDHPANVRPAERAEVEQWIRRLLDDQHYRAGLHRAICAERMLYLDTTRWYTQKLAVLRPMFDLECTRVIDHYDGHLRATAAPDVPSAMASMPAAFPGSRMGLGRVASGLSASLLPSMVRVFHVNGHAANEDRMMAVAMATRLYFLDHGRYPGSLDELVPRYLPHVPADAMAANGQPLRYILADEEKRPVVYSVGENGIDDTLDATGLPNRPCFGFQSNRNAPVPDDQWRDLSRWTPSAPTTAPFGEP